MLSGRTVHPEIPEGDTDDEIALAAKMREARDLASMISPKVCEQFVFQQH